MATAAKPTENTLVLPEALSSHTSALERALTTPMPWGWDEGGPSFIEAQQPAAIGRALIPAVHTHLLNRKIGYLFREKLAERGRTRLAQASKVGGKLQHFARLDFLVEVNWGAYRFLAPAQKIALLDHELCHFDVDDDKSILVAHDVEEFGRIVKRWGLWKLDLRLFNDAIKAAPQFELFAPPRKEQAAEPEPAKAKGKGKSAKGKKPTRVADIVPGIAAGL